MARQVRPLLLAVRKLVTLEVIEGGDIGGQSRHRRGKRQTHANQECTEQQGNESSHVLGSSGRQAMFTRPSFSIDFPFRCRIS